MDDSKREPFEPGEGSPQAGEGSPGPGETPPAADERLRERVSAARASIGEALRDAVERLEHSERAAIAAAEDRLSRIATERVDDALVRLAVDKGKLRAEIEQRTGRAVERLAEDIGERFGHAVERLEELAARSAAQGGGSERQTATVARVAEALPRIERAIAEIAEAERGVRAIEERVVRIEERVKAAAETASRAVDFQERMASATRIEAEAARRIEEAERRLLGRVREPGQDPTPGAPG